jgi:hypothetical protein
MEDPARDRMQYMLLVIELERMSGIWPALKSCNHIVIPGKRINQFALTLIAPLQAEKNIHFHHELYYLKICQ